MTTRVLLVADIHANPWAMKAFIEQLVLYPDVRTILNVGDFLCTGPAPREVAHFVLTDPRFINVLGNNEEALLELSNAEILDPASHRA